MGRIRIALDKAPGSQIDRRVRRNWRQIIPGLVISAIALVILLYIVDLKRLLSALRLADYRLVLLGILITLLWLVVRGFLWRTLLRDQASFGDAFWTLNEGYLLNNILPFRLGEIARAYLLSRKTPIAFWEVLSSIVIERTLDLAMAVGLLLSTLALAVGAYWARQAAFGVGISVLFLLGLLYIVARNREWVIDMINRLSTRWSFMQRVGAGVVISILNGLEVLTESGSFLRAIGWMLLNWIIAIGQYYVIMSAFVAEPKLLWAGFSLAVAAMGLAAPSSPGSVGVLELSIVGSLSFLGFDPTVALAFALTLHTIQYLDTGVLGGYALIKDGHSLLGLYRNLLDLRKKDRGDIPKEV